jgi:hypothetical protein
MTLAALLVLAVSLTGCTENTLAPRDAVAPSAPAGLALASPDGALALTWLPNAESDLAGYYVYRTPLGDEQGTAVQLNGDAVATSTYVLPAQSGEWLYQVRAADRSGNLSTASASITVTMGNGGNAAPITDEGTRRSQP